MTDSGFIDIDMGFINVNGKRLYYISDKKFLSIKLIIKRHEGVQKY
jgi:hypothetical protein